MKSRQVFPLVLFAASLLLLTVFLWWRWQLGLTRYFDADEFAHLHWASHMLMGRRPYVDFLTFFPPGYQVFLFPMFLFGWGTVTPIIAARVVSFLVFAAIGAMAAAIFSLRRGKSWLILLPPLILAFLPLPFDKTIEVRPDNLATLLVLFAVYAQIKWMGEGKSFWGVVSGACYSLSLLVLPKMLPNVAVGGLIALLSNRLDKGHLKPLAVGFFGPLILFGLWLLTLGNLDQVIYALIRLPFESNRISRYFVMLPNLFFYPNVIFYGAEGYGRGLVTNHALWLVGLAVGIYRLFTPFLSEGKKGAKEELLIAGTFIVQVIIYVLYVPLKHSQYLIPIAVFIAWYVADGIWLVWQKLKSSSLGLAIFMVGFLAGLLYLYQTFIMVSRPKLGWGNAQSLISLQRLLTVIPRGEYVLDLDGRTLYYPDPYFACCLPFGQFAPLLSRPLPSLSQALETTKTRYIYQGELMRVTTLMPADQAYIADRYRPHPDDPALLVRSD